MTTPRSAPPTLTEVIEINADDAALGTARLPLPPEALALEGFEAASMDADQLAERLFTRLQTRLDALLETRLTEVLESILARVADEAAHRVRDELHRELRRLVTQAVDEVLPGQRRR